MKFYEENGGDANQDQDLAGMSDEEGLDVESDEDDSEKNSATQYFSQAEKRAHHNALERKRRDHIKDSFTSLRDSVPSLQGEKVNLKASRAQILKKAAEYIQFMRRKNNSHQQDIDDLKRQNNLLETQIRTLEKARTTGNLLSAESSDMQLDNIKSESSPETSEDENDEEESRRNKKFKTEAY